MADGQDVRDLVPNDPAIRYVHQASFGSIGAKRNAGCELARGEIIAHFDDDDWSSPHRLAQQVERLQAPDRRVTGYYALPFTDGATWWQFTGRADYALGTSLCYWRQHWAANRFNDQLHIGEDNDFVDRSRPLIFSTDSENLMFATIHPENTSPRDLQSSGYKPIPIPSEFAELRRE